MHNEPLQQTGHAKSALLHSMAPRVSRCGASR
jgi:hypothetical protein